ncbi:hypothetical protein GC176_10455 [bacterium]|nr:hypothetical protein [bacterium]
MLIQSLRLIGGATTGDSASLRELRERATTHDRHHLNIGASLYAFWKQALLATVRDFDSEIDEETERAWETILDHAIAHMIRSY